MNRERGLVLLLYPPSETQRHTTCPAGLLMLAAVLEPQGFEVRLLDACAAANQRNADQVVEEIQRINPDVVGVTLVTPLVRQAYDLSERLATGGVKLIAGGPHATLLPEEPLLHGFQTVVAGEGEPTVVEAVEAVLGRIPKESVKGLSWVDAEGRYQRNEDRPLVTDLDSLPFPARHLVDPADYGGTNPAPLFGNLFSSRGCPARCAYCAGGLFGKRFRFRSAGNVLDEITLVTRQYGTDHFHFVDDTMAQNRDRMMQICQGIMDRKLAVTWSMMTRVDSLDEPLLDLAARSGCTRIDYGVESGNPETLKRIHKPHTLDMVKKTIPLTAKFGIDPCVFFILGFPWEGTEETKITLAFMKELAPYLREFHPAIASILVPFPGTEIYEKYKDQYGFANWWLNGKRRYQPPRLKTHSLFECRVFPLGAVLDADFFHYPQAVKETIYDVFQFMYLFNLKNRPWISRMIHSGQLIFSRRLSAVSPSLERRLFGTLQVAVRALRQRTGRRREGSA
ncbi:MAG: hypothetical protein A2Y79_03395 [Deltaproteobacteria bacterium RBG_13_43_22]|nr:MAG: hypothetical protein A2Y79_03395 [Deltaproteobacteria bacterium RBG_13_43_22]